MEGSLDESTRLVNSSKQTDKNCSQTSTKHEEKHNEPVLSRSRQNSLILSLLCLNFCIMSSDRFIFPFFGTAAKQKGLTDTQIGFVYTSYEIARFAAAPLYGMLITRLRPREMLFLGSLSSGLSVALFGVISGNGSVMFTVAMTSGLMKATTFKRTTIMAAIEGSLAAGCAAGPMFGAGLYRIGGYTPCFLVMGGVISVLSFLVLLTVPKIEDIGSSNTGLKEFLQIIAIPGVFLGGFLTMFMTQFGSTLILSFTTVWMTSEYGISASLASTFYIVAASTYGISCYPASRIIDKGFVWSLLVISIGTCSLLMLVFTPKILQMIFPLIQYKWWYSVATYAVQAALYSALLIAPYEAALQSAAVNGYSETSLKTHGILAGVIHCGLNLGGALSPMVAGIITEKFGFEWNTVLAASMYFLMVILYTTYLGWMKLRGKLLRPPKENTDDR